MTGTQILGGVDEGAILDDYGHPKIKKSGSVVQRPTSNLRRLTATAMTGASSGAGGVGGYPAQLNDYEDDYSSSLHEGGGVGAEDSILPNEPFERIQVALMGRASLDVNSKDKGMFYMTQMLFRRAEQPNSGAQHSLNATAVIATGGRMSSHHKQF